MKANSSTPVTLYTDSGFYCCVNTLVSYCVITFVSYCVIIYKRPQYHSHQTQVEFEFEVKMRYCAINGTRWKTID